VSRKTDFEPLTSIFAVPLAAAQTSLVELPVETAVSLVGLPAELLEPLVGPVGLPG
jgi:hypothetical protein